MVGPLRSAAIAGFGPGPGCTSHPNWMYHIVEYYAAAAAEHRSLETGSGRVDGTRTLVG